MLNFPGPTRCMNEALILSTCIFHEEIFELNKMDPLWTLAISNYQTVTIYKRTFVVTGFQPFQHDGAVIIK